LHNTTQKVRNTTKITSSQIFFQSWKEEKRGISGGSKVELFTYTWITQKVIMMGKFKKNSIEKASYAVIIHLNLLI
jgi:hypothetical protein